MCLRLVISQKSFCVEISSGLRVSTSNLVEAGRLECKADELRSRQRRLTSGRQEDDIIALEPRAEMANLLFSQSRPESFSRRRKFHYLINISHCYFCINIINQIIFSLHPTRVVTRSFAVNIGLPYFPAARKAAKVFKRISLRFALRKNVDFAENFFHIFPGENPLMGLIWLRSLHFGKLILLEAEHCFPHSITSVDFELWSRIERS